MSNILEIIGVILMSIGLFFTLTAGIGLFRLPDVYTRLHSAGKAGTFGFAFVVIGAALYIGDPLALSKAVCAVLFQFITAPIAAHVIARVALKQGIKPVKGPNDPPQTMDMRI